MKTFNEKRVEAVKLHIGFYSFIIKYILCTYLSTKNEESTIELKLDKQVVCILFHNSSSLPTVSQSFLIP